MKPMTKGLLMVAFTSACSYSNMIQGAQNYATHETFKLVKSDNEWWVARHWRKNCQDAYLTMHTRRTPATGARVFNVFSEDVVITLDETEEKFRTIKQECQTYELKQFVSDETSIKK